MSESSGIWTQFEISGQLADVFEPLRLADSDQVVLHLHDYEQETLRISQPFTTELDRHGLRVVCLRGGGDCWWTENICQEFHPQISPLAFIREYVVNFIRSHWVVDDPQCAVSGIGFGGQGALQLAYRYPREFPIVAAISPSVDFQNWYGRGLSIDALFANPEAARQQTATLHLHPLNWPRHQLIVCDPLDEEWFESSERLTSKLYSSGIPFEAELETSHGGHCWKYFDAMAQPVVRFLAERLHQQSRPFD